MSEKQAKYNQKAQAGMIGGTWATLAPEQRRLLDCLQGLDWGEVLVVVKNGLPVMVKRERKDIKLTD
mgnify:CR=1 FL=1